MYEFCVCMCVGVYVCESPFTSSLPIPSLPPLPSSPFSLPSTGENSRGHSGLQYRFYMQNGKITGPELSKPPQPLFLGICTHTYPSQKPFVSAIKSPQNLLSPPPSAWLKLPPPLFFSFRGKTLLAPPSFFIATLFPHF